MKTTLITSLVILITMLSSSTSEACVEQHPDSIVTRLMFDSTNCNVIVEISNLRLMGSDPNHFCSCGVNSVLSSYGDIVYVSFIDSTTNEPVLGFDGFDPDLPAGDSWNDSSGGFDWDGFVSTVNAEGLLQDIPVKLWIRLEYIPQGPNCLEDEWMWEFFYSGSFGTDEWDEENQVLSEDHQSISSFGQYLTIHYISDLDYYDSIVLGLEEQEQEELSIYPNPTNGILHIENVNQQFFARVYTMGGQQVFSAKASPVMDLSHLPNGIYYLQLHQNEKLYTQKLVMN